MVIGRVPVSIWSKTNYLDKKVTGICVASKQAITKEAEQT